MTRAKEENSAPTLPGGSTRASGARANQSKTIRLPVHLVDKIAHEIGMPANKVAHLKSVSIRPTSLDAPIGNEDGTEFGELVGDENAPNTFENLRSKSLIDDIK